MVDRLRRTGRHPVRTVNGPVAGGGDGSRPAIGVLGEVLVEVMRPRPNQPLDRPGPFEGPFASGAPAICAAAAAHLGSRVRFAGVVGRDAFGRACRDRLHEAGVDMSALRTVDDAATGVAFVAYRSDGEREFVFHLSHAAAAALGPRDVEALHPESLAWLHVSGSSLGVSRSMRRACEEAARRVAESGGTVAFDPNLRAELADPAEARTLCAGVMKYATVILPSGPEATLLGRGDGPAEACVSLLDAGARLVVLKRGAEGCTVFTPDGPAAGVDVPASDTQVRDPTGAGDVFAAGLAVALLEGRDPTDAARFAAAAAAVAITTLGPMEGLADRTACEAAMTSPHSRP